MTKETILSQGNCHSRNKKNKFSIEGEIHSLDNHEVEKVLSISNTDEQGQALIDVLVRADYIPLEFLSKENQIFNFNITLIQQLDEDNVELERNYRVQFLFVVETNH